VLLGLLALVRAVIELAEAEVATRGRIRRSVASCNASLNDKLASRRAWTAAGNGSVEKTEISAPGCGPLGRRARHGSAGYVIKMWQLNFVIVIRPGMRDLLVSL
jgi:hypothetical protein